MWGAGASDLFPMHRAGPVDLLHTPPGAFMHLSDMPGLGMEMQLLYARIEATHATEKAVKA